MRASLSNKPLLIVLLLACYAPSNVYPNDSGVKVISVDTAILGNDYVLSAEIDYRLSDKAAEALRNGVALSWTYCFKITENQNAFWRKTVLEKYLHYRIQYHALTNMYRVRNENTGEIENFSTLLAALDLMSTLRDFPLIETAKISGQANYLAAIKISFERDALPLPLRPFAYINPQWYLSSDWYEWSLKK
jgi:hypothetical protein